MNILKGLASIFVLCTAMLCFSGFVPVQPESIVIPAEEETNETVNREDLKYAYMDLKTAPAELHEKILAARNKIIFSSPGWVVGDYVGYVTDARTGEIIRELPRFYDLFPEDWDIPVYPPDTSVVEPIDDIKKPPFQVPDVSFCS